MKRREYRDPYGFPYDGDLLAVLDALGQPHQHCIVTDDTCGIDYRHDDHSALCCECSRIVETPNPAQGLLPTE